MQDPFSLIKLHLAACVLSALAACSATEKPTAKPTQTEQPRQEIKNWQMSAQGKDNWSLSAKTAQQTEQHWQLTDLLWQSNQSQFKVSSPQANQTKSQIFVLHPVLITGPQLKAKAPHAILELNSHQLKGDEIELQGQNWFLQAKHFHTTFPLRHWQFQQVHARFQSKP